jgi:Na+/H+ antiporter NhaD/arsenite permease-like protein
MKKILMLILAFLTVMYLIPTIISAEEAISKEIKTIETDKNAHIKGENKSQEHEKKHGTGHGVKGEELPLWSVIPFAGILLSIALFPLIASHFWHEHFPKISAMWSLIFAIPFLIIYKGTALYEILHIYIADYIPFIILLWALFTISGGIYIRGTLKGNPAVNTILLLIGTALASWIGTTGAAMLLIRPVLRSNSWRRHKVHTIIFFIFTVCNIGGSLTPLGDPPLFLGFLHGVDFFWTLNNLIPHMSFAVVILLIMYFIFDTYFYAKEDKSKMSNEEPEPFRIEGAHNFLFLAGVVAGVLFSGLVKIGTVNIFGIHTKIQFLLRDGFLILMGILSLIFTRKEVRESNEFTWFPIQEVAYLFAGIFMTIIPALAILKAGDKGSLAWLINSVKQPYHYFWITGILSSFLDNAPTYLTFFNTALGSFHAEVLKNAGEANAVIELIKHNNIFLQAIAAGAVFMGANTYIGNAPNFMVKSIAEESGIPMPSFFGYLFKYAVPILIPIFILVTFVFF